MIKSVGQRYPQSRHVNSWVYIAILLANVFLFACIGAVYIISTQSYSKKLFNEHIRNVESINAASANAAYTYTRDMGIKINDVVNYIKTNRLSVAEAARYLGESNTAPERQFQLVLSGSFGSTGMLSFGDYSGLSVRKAKKADGTLETLEHSIVYGSGYYDILRSFTDINDENLHSLCFTPEFTDPDTKLKCFAVYRHAVLTDAEGQKKLYTILMAINSKTALNVYNMQDVYAGQSTVLINENGDYIIKNSNYRNANFFDYLSNYNGLPLRWRGQTREAIRQATQAGAPIPSLLYKNHQGQDSVFSITPVTNGWHSVTCVPLSSFKLKDDATNYSLIILLLFLALFVFDGVAILFGARVMNHNVTVAELATEEATQANQAKSRFLSTMSHELRTPLNAIIGFAALSRDCINDPPVLKDYLKKINISSKLLLQLISDILDVSAIESNKMKISKSEFELAKLITSLSAIYYAQCASKGIDFSVQLKNIHSDTLVGDSVRVNQVLLNFLSNAVKFTPNGGKVALRVETIGRTDTTARIRFEVADTGCGISDELKARLFRPFERAAGSMTYKYSGSGLGLSIAKTLVELMDGQIGVDSREGAGSRFWVEIPFALPPRAARRSFSPIKSLRALAVVSNADEREYIGQILSNLGVTHTLADSAAAALTLLREEQAGPRPFNLCILDWKMSDLDALDATRTIRKTYDSAALRIMILAYDLAETKAQCIIAGADFTFGKPVFSSELYNTLEDITSNAVRAMPQFARQDALAGKRVLLVEDHQINIEVARLTLIKFGLDVETAENGQLGYECFVKSAPGAFDAILMDIQMPVMNGYQATRAIRASSHPDAKTIPILAMTADAFSEDVERARSAGMNAHLAKPIEPGKLYEVLQTYLCR